MWISFLANRMNTSELIRQLITACDPASKDELCDYVNRTQATAYSGSNSSVIGKGMKDTLWQLALALIFKVLITIFTFGIKVSSRSISAKIVRKSLVINYIFQRKHIIEAHWSYFSIDISGNP